MSLQYIIDGNNIINHTQFFRVNKRIQDPRLALLSLIKIKKLTGSTRNKVTVVFDGFPNYNSPTQENTFGIEVIFSRNLTADEKIEKILMGMGNPLTAVVVSDDKQIKLFAKSYGSKAVGVEEFILPAEPRRPGPKNEDPPKAELNYTQVQRINEELKKTWLS